MISSFHSLPGTGKPFLYMNHGIDLNFTPPQDLDQSSHLLSSLAQGNSSLMSPSFYPSFSIFILVSLSLICFSLSPAAFPFIFYISTSLFIFQYYILWIFYPLFLYIYYWRKKILKQAWFLLLQFTNSQSNFIRILVFLLFSE